MSTPHVRRISFGRSRNRNGSDGTDVLMALIVVVLPSECLGTNGSLARFIWNGVQWGWGEALRRSSHSPCGCLTLFLSRIDDASDLNNTIPIPHSKNLFMFPTRACNQHLLQKECAYFLIQLCAAIHKMFCIASSIHDFFPYCVKSVFVHPNY